MSAFPRLMATAAGIACIASPQLAPARPKPWCAAGLQEIEPGMCTPQLTPPSAARRAEGSDDYGVPPADGTLLIFLHGVIKPDTTWQHNQQLAAVRAAKTYGLSVIAPRGRRGNGPKTMKDWWTWPTSVAAQRAFEVEIHAQWRRGRQRLERHRGRRFRRVLIFGFSNGAYYATGLALGGRYPADGFGIFAGGAAPAYLTRRAVRQRRRPPIVVGYGLKDKAWRDPAKLARTLKRVGWPSSVIARRNAGHVMADSMVRHAMTFFDRRWRTSGDNDRNPE